MLNEQHHSDSSAADPLLRGSAVSLADVLQCRAACHPHRTAYTFLDFGASGPQSLTYAELNRNAKQLAAQLQQLGMRNEPALLLYPPGLDYIVAFFACLYAGTIAVPAYPPSNNRHMPRLLAILNDSKAKIVLTTGQIANNIRPFAGAKENWPVKSWLQTDGGEPVSAGLWQAPNLQETDLAFLQYTSGSTGEAKGVMISHGNLMANQRLIKQRFGHDERSTVVGWLPLYHDMGLIGNVMQPLYCGAGAILMSPMAFLEKPLRWLQAISDYRAHTSGGPNFAYELCVQKIDRDALAGIDLSGWQLAFNGAEPINPCTLQRFSEAFAGLGFRRRSFYPCYGLAEATLLATGGTKQTLPKVAAFDKAALAQGASLAVDDCDPNARSLVSCGTVDGDFEQALCIIDPESHAVCANGEIGEIWLGGPCIAQGYWHNPTVNSEIFVKSPGGQRWLRTGDLGFINDGELFVSGRLKDLIIIRGRNYYPHDLEYAIESATDALNPASTVAFSIDGDGEKLIILAELKRNRIRQADYRGEFAAMRARLTEECGIHADRILLLKPGAVLKTSSGKLRRAACRERFLDRGFEYVAADGLPTAGTAPPMAANIGKDANERHLLRQALLSMPSTVAAELLAERLTLKAAELSGLTQDTIEPNQPLTSLGLDSLKAVEMKYFIDELLAVDIPITSLLGNATLFDTALTALNLAGSAAEPPSGCESVGEVADTSMSYNQQALWTRAKIDGGAGLYHMPAALRIRGELNLDALSRALAELCRRHAQLRCGFDLGADNRPLCLPLDRVALSPERTDCSDEAQRRENLRVFVDKPFDLQRGPLLRCGIFSCKDDDHILAFCAHHLIVDFRSLRVLLAELQTLYAEYLNGTPAKLPPPQAGYAEFVAWQRNYLNSEAAEGDCRYWQDQLAGELPRLELPSYSTAEPVCDGSGGAEKLSIASDTLIRLKNLADGHCFTLYTLLLTVFKTLLYRYCAQQDLIVGTPTLGRPLSRFADLVGYFVNPVALRSKPGGDLRFRDYLSAVNTVVLGALEHQHYPQTRVIENLCIGRKQGTLELYRVFFVFQDGSDPAAAALAIGNVGINLQWAGCDARSTLSLPDTAEEFDLAMLAAETGDGLAVTFRYRRDVLQRKTVLRLLAHFQCLLHGVLADPDCLLSELPLLTVPERRQQMAWNSTAFNHPDIPTLQRLFETQTEKTPDAIALIFEEQSLTYAALNAKANQLAHYLIERGVGPDILVGICLERSLDMVIGLLGILKAGGVYVPLDPNYPAERRALILADAGVKLLLTREALDAELAENAEDQQTVGYASRTLSTPNPDSSTKVRDTYPADLMTARGRVVYLDRDGPAIAAYPATTPTMSMHPLHLAYLIYTSGSTGRPKGVAVCHGNAVHSTLARFQAYPDPVEAYLLLSSFAFDSSVAGIFWTLSQGGCLCLPRDDAGKDPAELATLIERHRVSHLLALPSLYRLLLEQPVTPLSSLKAAIVAGEACATDVVRRHFEVLPTVKLYNEYGPTEGTVWSSVYPAGLDDLDKPLSIGRPIANVRLYILDRHLNPLPIGVAGELYIGGAGVVRGYLQRAELTAERFIPDPFQADGGRLYKTGDLARYRPDGAIEFLGRLDHQVKIRGFRIELGEIETRLLAHDKVKEAVVLAREDQPGDKKLVAYLVLCESAVDQHDEAVNQLKGHLKQALPDYMVPGAFVVLDAMPLSANGKMDRQRLPAPDWGEQYSNQYMAPRNEAEQTLVEIWQQLLAIDRIGRHDNFFELGGDSILSIQVVSRARQAGIVISPKQLFERPTIAELALVAETVSRAVAEQGPVTGHVTLTPIQHWFFEQGLNNPHHWNQALMLNVKPELTPAAFAAAVRKLLVQHDALRMRFGEDDGLWRQTNLAEETETVFEYIDLAAVIGEQQLERLRTEATARQAALNLSQGPLLRAAWFDLGKGDHRILMTIHHLVVDGVSWRILLEDLETLCRPDPTGQNRPLPAKTTSFKYWSERLSQLTRNGALNVNPDYWLATQRAQAATLPVDYPHGANQAGLEDEITVTLNAEQTQRLLQEVPAAYRTQIDDLLLTALALTLRDWLADNALAHPAATETLLLIDRESHGREHLADDLDITRTVGWFSNVYPLLLALPEGDDLAQALKAVKEQIRAVPEHGIGYGLLRYLSADARIRQALADQPPARILFNYLGQLDTAPGQEPLFILCTETTGLSRDPTGKRSHELEVIGSILNSCLQLSWRYSRERYRRDTLETLANRYLKHLQALIGHCSQTGTGGYTPSDFPLAALSPAQLDALNLPARQIDDLYPLAPLQHGLIFHSLYEPNANVYRIQLACRLTGRLDAAVFQQAWRQLLERHAILRTRFLTQGLEQPLQLVDKRARLPIIEHDWRNLPDAERHPRWQQLQQADQAQGFDFDKAPLMRLHLACAKDDLHYLLWSYHHVLLDGWSMPLLIQEVFNTYHALQRNELPNLPAVNPYRDYIAWLQRQDMAAAECYWRQALAGFEAATILGADRAPGDKSTVGASQKHSLQLTKEETLGLQQFTKRRQLTLNTLAQAAWGLLLSHYSGNPDVVFGITVSGRPAELLGIENQIGLFINTLPMRVQLNPQTNIGGWLQNLFEQNRELRRYEYAPLAQIQAWSDIGRGQTSFDSLLVFENYPIDQALLDIGGPLKIDEVTAIDPTNYPLTLTVFPGERLQLEINHDSHRFTPDTVVEMLTHLQQLLTCFSEQPQTKLGNLPTLTADQHRQILVNWNATGVEYPQDRCIHQLFEAQVEKTPDAIALSFEDNQLTYAELNAKANQLAHYLIERGVGPDVLVGICLERSLEMVIGLLGILKAGGAYVPLDPNYPAERRALIFADAGVKLLLTREALNAELAADQVGDADPMDLKTTRGGVVCLDRDGPAIAGYPATNPSVSVHPLHLAYLIYTSGSTGRPKGVAVNHRNAVHSTWARLSEYPEPVKAYLLLSSFAFDSSVAGIFWTLAQGGCLCLPHEDSSKDPVALAALIERHDISHLLALPSLYAVLLEQSPPALSRLQV
ncbi:non-ribosomal peptide synthetase, partial [Methylomonas rivi]|nr:amino acid adenylation domain-containing protein [Methylomonas sp. WSC-6]